MLHYAFGLVFNALMIHLSISENECCFNSSFAYRDHQYILLSNFENFTQLKFNCQLIEMSFWEFHPLLSLILDQSLNLKNSSIRIHSSGYLSIMLNKLKGFDLNSNPFRRFIADRIIWQFINLNFDFYLHNNLIADHLCNSKLSWSLTENIRILSLNEGIRFTSEICPFIFKNALFYLLAINKISSSFVDENILKFQNKTALNLNSSIYQLQLDFYHIELNSNILNVYAFKKLKILDLNGPINSIQPDLFKSFDYLRQLRLRSQNVRKLFAKNNKWLNFLNLKTNNRQDSFLLVIYQAFSNVSFYEYPDEDFCLFKSFPHRQNVLPVLKPTFKSKCTCLELFLIQYSAKSADNILKQLNRETSIYTYVQYYSDIIFEKKFSICVNSSLIEFLIDCNFYRRLKNCQIEQIDRKDDFLFYVYDWIQIKDIIQIFFPKYINLICAVLGIIINTIMIIIFSNKKIMCDKMYTYLEINSFFNLLICITLMIGSTIKYLEVDLKYLTYLSSGKILVQYLNLILIKFGLNLLRSCSNISYFSFVLSRYIMISNTKSFIVEKFQKLTKAKFILSMFAAAFFINVHIIFRFKIINSASLVNVEQLHSFNPKNFSYFYKQEPIEDYKENFSSQSEYLILNLAQYAQIIFSDLLYLIATIIVDVLLLIFIKKKIKTNQKLNAVVNIEMIGRIQRIKRKRQAKKSKNRILQMIILNGINFLLLRLPLAILSFYGFLFKYNREKHSHMPSLISYIICKERRFCASLQEVFMSFYLVSFCFQFFIFFKLDLNLKSSLLDLKKKFLIRIKFKKKITEH